MKKPSEIITIGLFLSAIFFFSVIFFVTKDITFSEEENRVLQQAPKFSVKNLVSGKFNSDVGKYYSDQFPFRNTFVGVKTAFSYAFLQNQNKGVVIGKDGYIFQRFDIYDDVERDYDLDFSYTETMNTISDNALFVSKFAASLADDVTLCFAVPWRKIDVVTTNALPDGFPADRNEVFYTTLEENLNSVELVQFKSLHDMAREGEYVYYKTDHHWTTPGAYYAYKELGVILGYTPNPKDFFNFELVSDKFYGTTWSKLGAKWIEPDSMYYPRFEGDENYTTDILEIKSFKGFYDREQLTKKDKYASFIGGINARTTITKNGNEPREKLLFITDSFGQSLAPFLAVHFDLEIIDLRFYKDNIHNFIAENSIKKILVMQNMESLSTQKNLIKLLPE